MKREDQPLRPLVVVAGALVAGGRVLVQQRPVGKAHGGLWEFPGGKVEPGERIEAALVRELDEELGIVVDAAGAMPLAFATASVGVRQLVLLLFVIRRWIGEPQALDAAAIAWVPSSGLSELPMPDADRALIAAVRTLIGA